MHLHEAGRGGLEPLFEAGLVVAAEVTDFDRFAALAPGWDLEFMPMGPGPLACKMRAVHTAFARLGRSDYSGPFSVRGRVPHGTFAFMVAETQGGNPILSGGRALDPLECVYARDHEGFEVAFGGPTRQLSLSVSEALLDHMALQLWKTTIPTGGRLRFADADLRERFVAVAVAQLRFHRSFPELLKRPEFASRFEDRILEELLHSCRPELRVAPTADRHHSARKARELIVSRLNAPLSLAELCAELDVNERTLLLGFNELYGVGPKHYAKKLRLYRVYRDLQQGDEATTVTGVAVRWGFFHFGRFSHDYRQLFGQAPSQTLASAARRNATSRDALPRNAASGA